MRGYLLSRATGAASMAVMASDIAQAGGLSSDNPQSTADDASGAGDTAKAEADKAIAEQAAADAAAIVAGAAAAEADAVAARVAAAADAAKVEADKAKAKPAKSSKAKTAKVPITSDEADAITAALSDGFVAVIWCGAGHEQFRPQDVVLVQAEAYEAIRAKGHARDAEASELAAAIQSGKTIHWL